MDFIDDYDHEDPNIVYIAESIPIKETIEQFNEQLLQCCQCGDKCTIETNCTCLNNSGSCYREVVDIANNRSTNHGCITDQSINTNDGSTTPIDYIDLPSKYTIDIHNPSKPIYECNDKCKCSWTCGNRLVQYGPRKNLKIIECMEVLEIPIGEKSKKGRGLITTKFIKSNSFICEYAGEILNKEESARRFALNESNNLMNYIFCLNEKFGTEMRQTLVDPSKFGNIGRYLNHSCDPNCHIIPIRINNGIPKLCIFSSRDILENTELCFDYGENSPRDLSQATTHLKLCLCEAANCRKFMPFDKEASA